MSLCHSVTDERFPRLREQPLGDCDVARVDLRLKRNEDAAEKKSDQKKRYGDFDDRETRGGRALRRFSASGHA
jgi:hypothetical protein